ncbi:SGNH/GDSL hydrolase family protein [Levilactobacillus tujiorum]|uniref:SGNH/GDSL hydrolase family protein n=1 Tax=Levilactobacillus tujiorum TaxID=2912243 RepID=UPI001456384B|nr:SGNH/GDSL hydrolase family protein [Levilactobacillus tujiorum]NLR31941.1 SGNH/GDSL hydrolase family protein [Levilactobacillus tujiorum]
MKKPLTLFDDKIINCFGDSTTWGDNGVGTGGNQISWTTSIQNIIKFKELRNYGVCGSRIAVKSDRDDSFIERYEAMDNDADIITVFGGVNDFQHDIPLGELGDTDVQTFYGALDTLIHGLVKKYPNQPIIFMTPTKNNFHHPTKNYPTTLQSNEVGLHQKDYVEAMLKICDFYSLPVIDLYKESGVSPFLPEYVPKFHPDGLHYSQDGYSHLAHRIAGELLRFIF